MSTLRTAGWKFAPDWLDQRPGQAHAPTSPTRETTHD